MQQNYANYSINLDSVLSTWHTRLERFNTYSGFTYLKLLKLSVVHLANPFTKIQLSFMIHLSKVPLFVKEIKRRVVGDGAASRSNLHNQIFHVVLDMVNESFRSIR